jgi:transcriptional antiterminator NusG
MIFPRFSFSNIVPGDTVTIIDGAFKQFEGVVEAVNDEYDKVTVLVEIFGCQTPLELEYSEVEHKSD